MGSFPETYHDPLVLSGWLDISLILLVFFLVMDLKFILAHKKVKQELD